MELRRLDDSGGTTCDLGELRGFRQRDNGFVWLDIPVWSAEARAAPLGQEAGLVERRFGHRSRSLTPGSVLTKS